MNKTDKLVNRNQRCCNKNESDLVCWRPWCNVVDGCVDVYRDKKLADDLVGCTVTFDADLSALHDAIHQFGHVTETETKDAAIKMKVT